MKAIVLTLGIGVALPLVGIADVRPSALFTDHMVIQRETQAPVWGTADAGESVTVSGSWGETAATTADASGKWSVKLQTPPAGGPHTLTLKGNNTVEIKDVLSGEVWFCSGQSNMDFELSKLAKIFEQRTEKRHEPAATYVKQEMETAQDSMLRQFTVQKNRSPLEPLETLSGQWVASSPQNNPDFSGTAYFFGRELRKELNVPVGLIKCAWSGTKVEPWIPAEAFQEDEEMEAYYEANMLALKNRMTQWDPAKAEADYQAARKKNRRARRQANPQQNQQLPSTLFNAMVNPVIPYAIRGTIWYQGESNAGHNTLRYETNFSTMIHAWRDHWGQGDFPFYFAQLANYQGRSRADFRPPVAEPVEYDGWPSICDQQRRTLRLKNTGMAVLSDIGEPHDVHPHNKMDVGKRLALWALKHDYPSTGLRAGGKAGDIVCSGPLYQRHTIKGDQVIIQFDHAGSGLMSGKKPVMDAAQATKEPLRYFQICGADRQWHWAQAEITGNDTVTVSHPEVPNPTVVRYAWSMNAESANLYNKEGLPASIFTTETEIPDQAAAAPVPESVRPSSVSVWQGKKSSFHGFDQYQFKFEGVDCKVVLPKKIADGKPWVWRARFWGHQPQFDLAMLKRGYHIVYCPVDNMFGNPAAVKRWDAFYDYLRFEHLFSDKPILEGMSRGGLIIYNWAAANPDKVQAIYGDAPVMDFKSWPGGKGQGKGSAKDWRVCLKAYGFTEAQALAYTGNPLDNLALLAKAKIPILHVVGDADDIVPVAENTAIAEARYKKLGGVMKVIHKSRVGHHPHSLKDPGPIVDFVTQQGNGAGELSTEERVVDQNLSLHSDSRNSRIQFEQKSPTKASLQKDDRIVFLGDSITQLGAKEDGYVTLTAQAIQQAYPGLGVEVIGAGISGNKVPNCQKRLDRDVLQKQPTVVVIYIGINDVWHWTLRTRSGNLRKGTTPEKFESGLKDMIAKINGVGARVILCTPSVIGEKHDGSSPDDDRLDAYAAISRKVALETRSQLLDLRKALIDTLKARNPENADRGILTKDRVHMNEAGNRLLSELVLRALNVPGGE